MQHTITGGQGYAVFGEIRGVLRRVELPDSYHQYMHNVHIRQEPEKPDFPSQNREGAECVCNGMHDTPNTRCAPSIANKCSRASMRSRGYRPIVTY
jgi:hypothetical protein